MCGIWFLCSKTPLRSDYSVFHSKLKNRGPDDYRIIQKQYFCIAFYRLAIIDLSPKGMQPFMIQYNKMIYYLVCNGEIYNYRELIQKYELECQSGSDCEVILSLYIKCRNDFAKTVSEIQGEFALLLIEYDTQHDTIHGFATRDPYGVRPLFWGVYENSLCFSSLLKGMTGLCSMVKPFPPGKYMEFFNYNVMEIKSFYKSMQFMISENPIMIIYREICERLIMAVRKRILSDRPIGALLSGGLDSSLVVGILDKILKVKDVSYFSIGLEGEYSTDLEFASLTAKHLGIQNNHEIIMVKRRDAIAKIDQVIECCETYDITTIRASTMQYMLAEHIKNNSDIRVVLNGDGADEVEMGYLYFHYAPSFDKANNENIRLLNEIYLYDGLRVDRTLGDHGLEARLPYLDPEFVDYYLSIPISLRVPGPGIQEKKLIRDAFHTLYPDLLPKEVLYRKKEAFSDGVSNKDHSWYKMIQDHADGIYTDDSLDFSKYSWNKPLNKESYYYREIFHKYFSASFSNNYEMIIPHFWMPNFVSKPEDPSARELKIYHEEEKK